MSFVARQIDAPEVLKAPNFNFISANVEQTSGGNQTESAKPTSTNKVLAVSSFQEMVGILKQVNMVAYHASSIFSSLGKKVQETSRKVRKVSDRIASLEKDVFDMEQQKNSDSSFTRVEDSGVSSTYMESESSSTLRNEVQSFQNFFTADTRDDALNALYGDCMPPPPLETMDTFLPKNSDRPQKSCVLKYSNPQYFMEQWIKQEVEKLQKYQLDKEEHKRRHRQNVNQETKLTNNVFGTAEPLTFGNATDEHYLKHSPRTIAKKSTRMLDEQNERYSKTLSKLAIASKKIESETTIPGDIYRNAMDIVPKVTPLGEQNDLNSSPAIQSNPTSLNGENSGTITVPENKVVAEESVIGKVSVTNRSDYGQGAKGESVESLVSNTSQLPVAPSVAKKTIEPPSVTSHSTMVRPSPKIAFKPGLASFLDDVKKFRKDTLRPANEKVASPPGKIESTDEVNGGDQSSQNDKIADSGIQKKSKPVSLLEAIRKRASTVDESNRNRNISIDAIIKAKKKRRAQSYKETGVAAILAHRIAVMGGDDSEDEKSGSSSDEWD